MYYALDHLYGGGLTFPFSGYDSSNLLSFEQGPFFPDGDAYAANMGQLGFVFVPSNCQLGEIVSFRHKGSQL